MATRPKESGSYTPPPAMVLPSKLRLPRYPEGASLFVVVEIVLKFVDWEKRWLTSLLGGNLGHRTLTGCAEVQSLQTNERGKLRSRMKVQVARVTRALFNIIGGGGNRHCLDVSLSIPTGRKTFGVWYSVSNKIRSHRWPHFEIGYLNYSSIGRAIVYGTICVGSIPAN